MASDTRVIPITCTSLNTGILPVLLFACISVSSASSTGCVPVTVSNICSWIGELNIIMLQCCAQY